MKLFKKLRYGMAYNIIGAMVMALCALGIIVSAFGFMSYTNAFKKEYSLTTYHMARTAATLVNGDNIDLYLEKGGMAGEYIQSKKYLDNYCEKISVSLIYVIKVDTSDYGRFVSVFNSVDNSVGGTDYTPWEIGFKRDTTNDEYREKYKKVYTEEAPYQDVYRTKNLNGKLPHITTIVPVKNSAGEVVALLCVQRPISELREGTRPYLLNVTAATIILAVFASLVIAQYIKRQFIIPVGKISDEAVRFANENTKGKALGDISKITEIAGLAHSVDTMETDMLNYIDNLTAITAEKERIGAELSVARTIQENSIPNDFPAFPEIDAFDIYASMTPAKEVGGDFYNFFLIDEDRLAFVIGDVSGKGVPAALFMMVTNILISHRTRMGGTPAQILEFLNDTICSRNNAEMFVTLWLGILEISTGKVIAANAGHDDAAVYRSSGEFELFKTKHNIVVGAIPKIKFTDYEIQLNKGDKLFLYTDGVPEATDKDNRMFTVDNMLKALNENKNKSPKDILEGVRESVNAFVGEAPQFDDLTMLCIEIMEKENKNIKSLTVDATVDNLDEVIGFVDAFLEENGCPMKKQMQFDLALEEAYVNVAHYAYGDETGKAEVVISEENGAVTIVLKDSGVPYNPLEKEDPDVTLSAEERQIGGLGIFLVKKNMDSVSYEYKNGQNILTMTKNL